MSKHGYATLAFTNEDLTLLLQLHEGYEVVGCHVDIMRRLVYFAIKSDSLPSVEPGCEAPTVQASYTDAHDTNGTLWRRFNMIKVVPPISKEPEVLVETNHKAELIQLLDNLDTGALADLILYAKRTSNL
jgi:hypothetical protein